MSTIGNPSRTANSPSLGAQRNGRNLVEPVIASEDKTGREAPIPVVRMRLR